MVTLPNVGIVKAQGTIYMREDGSDSGTVRRTVGYDET